MPHKKTTALLGIIFVSVLAQVLAQWCPTYPEQPCTHKFRGIGLTATAPGFSVFVLNDAKLIEMYGNSNKMPLPGLKDKVFVVHTRVLMIKGFAFEYYSLNLKNLAVATFFERLDFNFTSIHASSKFVVLLASNHNALAWDTRNITMLEQVVQISISANTMHYLSTDGRLYAAREGIFNVSHVPINMSITTLISTPNSTFVIAATSKTVFAIDELFGIVKHIHVSATYMTIANEMLYAVNDSSSYLEYNVASDLFHIHSLNWGIISIDDLKQLFYYNNQLVMCSKYGVFENSNNQLQHVELDKCETGSSTVSRICLISNNTFLCKGDFSDMLVLYTRWTLTTTVLVYLSFSVFIVAALLLLCINLCFFKSVLHWFQQFHILLSIGANICHFVVMHINKVFGQWQTSPSVPIGIVLLALSYIVLAIVFFVIFIKRAVNKESYPHCIMLLLIACILLQVVVFLFLIAAFLELFPFYGDAHYLWMASVNVPSLFELFCVEIAVLLDWKQNKVREQKHKDQLLLELAFQKSTAEVELNVLTMDLSIMTIPFSELSDLEEIGSGASGMVIKAKWRNQLVAVKLFRYACDSMIGMFNKELQLLLFLRHENIVNMYGVCNEHPRYAIVMEYCSNHSLIHLIHTKQLQQMHVQLISDVAHGMNYLHNRNVLHRDLKPDNVLITEKWVAKIADFGTSKIGSSSQAMTTRIGTSWYMAPEVVQGQEYNEKCDVFSFGILVFQVVFEAVNPYGTNHEVEYMVAKNPTYRPTIPESLLWWQNPLVAMIKKCWDHNPMARPTFEEICFELQNMQ